MGTVEKRIGTPSGVTEPPRREGAFSTSDCSVFSTLSIFEAVAGSPMRGAEAACHRIGFKVEATSVATVAVAGFDRATPMVRSRSERASQAPRCILVHQRYVRRLPFGGIHPLVPQRPGQACRLPTPAGREQLAARHGLLAHPSACAALPAAFCRVAPPGYSTRPSWAVPSLPSGNGPMAC